MGFLFAKKQTITNTENKIGALRVQSSSQGVPIPIVFGKTRIAANLLDYRDFTAIPHTETQTSGGKGGGGVTTESTTYTYTVAAIFGLMEGPSFAGTSFLGTCWSNKDVTNATALGLSQFDGSYSQAPWAYMVSNHAADARNYRGQAYAAAAAFDLGSSDGLPNLTFEVIGLLGSTDVNLAAILESVLTSDKFGAGWPAAQLGSLTDFSNYCAAAGFAASPAYTAQRPAAEMVEELCRMGNSAPVWSEGLLKVKTYADQTVGSYVPDLTVQYALTNSDFIAPAGEPPVKITRKRQADAFNVVQVECLDRANQYNNYVAEAKDQASIETYGLRPMEPIEAHAICDANVGRSVAQTILQRELYVRNVYEFTVGWRYGRLEPMDIVSITDSIPGGTGLANTPVRIRNIEENENGELAMTAEDVNIGVSTPGVYQTQPTQGSTPQAGADPGDTYAPVIFQPPLALTGGVPQVWIGAQGGVEWGGCEIWISTDGGSSYGRAGQITNPARFGLLTANFPVGLDPDTVNTLAVNLTVSRGDLVDTTTANADAKETLSYVQTANSTVGELISFSNVVLTSPYNYNLDTYIRRGQGGSTIAAHVIGQNFMRLDEAVAHLSIPTSLYGVTLNVKLLSYNTVGGSLQALADVTPTTFTPTAQVQTGAGFSFTADRSSIVVGDPGAGKMRWNNASQAAANQVVFDALTADGANMVSYFANVGSAGYMDLRDIADPAKWATYNLTTSNAPAGYQVFGVTYTAGGAEIPTGDTVLVTFSPTPPTGVTQVGLVLPATLFNVTNNSVTTTGNLTASLITQNAATVFAGPITGNAAAAPAFRALVAADIPFSLSNPMTTTGDSIYGGANGVATRLPAGSANGMVMTMANGIPAWVSPRLNTQTANYTLTMADMNQPTLVEANSANSVVFTVPSFANVPAANMVTVLFARYGNGSVTISAQANVTVHNASSSTLRAVKSVAGITQRAPNEWYLFGDTT